MRTPQETLRYYFTVKQIGDMAAEYLTHIETHRHSYSKNQLIMIFRSILKKEGVVENMIPILAHTALCNEIVRMYVNQRNADTIIDLSKDSELLLKDVKMSFSNVSINKDEFEKLATPEMDECCKNNCKLMNSSPSKEGSGRDIRSKCCMCGKEWIFTNCQVGDMDMAGMTNMKDMEVQTMEFTARPVDLSFKK